jgi:hypothetical protein
VTEVIGQLQPAIVRTVAQLLGNGATLTTQGATGASRDVSFNQGATGASGSTSFSQGTTGSVGTTSFGSSGFSSSSSSSGLTASELTSSVVASLQPSIAAAVANALSASSASSFNSKTSTSSSLTSSALTQEEEAKLNAQLSANAQYEYGYKVADDDAQAYMAHEETRNGQNVEGKYNYVDANGALVTVTYQAGPEGYSETRDVQDGAVEMRNVYGAWDGPYADTVPAGVSSTSGAFSQVAMVSARGSSSSERASSSLSQSDIIAQVLAALQPQISGAVQSAISATSSTTSSGSSVNSAQRNSVTGSRQTSSVIGSGQANSFIGSRQANSVVGSRQANSAVGSLKTSSVSGQSQANLISSIIGKLQPQISGAVNAALSSSKQSSIGQVSVRPVPVARPRPTTYEARTVSSKSALTGARTVSSSSGLTGIFGTTGENSVRIETPDFTTVY